MFLSNRCPSLWRCNILGKHFRLYLIYHRLANSLWKMMDYILWEKPSTLGYSIKKGRVKDATQSSLHGPTFTTCVLLLFVATGWHWSRLSGQTTTLHTIDECNQAMKTNRTGIAKLLQCQHTWVITCVVLNPVGKMKDVIERKWNFANVLGKRQTMYRCIACG